MNPQYMNQQPPGGYNRMPASSQPGGFGPPGQMYNPGQQPAMAGPPGNFGAPPPNSMGGYQGQQQPPPNSMGGQPGQQPPPPNSMGGHPGQQPPPPNSMGGHPGQQPPPPNSMGAPQQPPNSMFNGQSQRPMGPPGTFGGAPGKAMSQPPSGPPQAIAMNGSLANGPPSGPGFPGQVNNAQQPNIRGPVPNLGQGMPPRPPMGGQPNSGPPVAGQPGPPPSVGQPMTGVPTSGQAFSGPQMGGQPGPQPPQGQLMGGQPLQRPPMAGQQVPMASSSGQQPGPPSGQPRGSVPPGQAPPNSYALQNQMGALNLGSGVPSSGAVPMYSGAPPTSQPLAPGPPPPGRPPTQGATQPQPPRPGYPQQQMPGGNYPPTSNYAAPGSSQPNAAPFPNQYPPPPSPGGTYPPAQPSPGGAYPGSQPPGAGGFTGTRPNAVGGMPAPAPQPSQPRRLDPDQMPSPIQVIEDDRRTRTGEFSTGQRGSVPPLVTTDFTVEDRGNVGPRMLRSTMYNIPCTNDMMKQSHMPFVVSATPFARPGANENPLPIVDLGALGPVRCNRCKAYMNPYMQFVDGGRRFQCCFCGCATEVPPEYFAHLDHTGRRVDSYDRPELCLGAYEFVATTDYCKNNRLPKPPAYIFMIDVSYNAVKSGLVQLLCRHLKEEVLVNLPKELGMDESEIRVGFVTYGKTLQFYNVKSNLAQPQMLVVSDVQDVFVPLVDGFLVKLSESEVIIDSLLAQIPQTFAESRETETVLGPVIEAGLDALKAAECTGKLIVFHTSLPIAEAPGKLKNRDDRKLLGTDKEKTILTPQSNYYTKLGQDCVAAGCGVDLFLFPNAYMDIASIAEVPRLTGGNIFKYSYFQADLDGPRLIEDLKSNVMRPIGFDCIMRVRTSTGIRPVDFLGNFYMANTTDVEIASMDCDKTVTVEIKHDDKLSEGDGAFIQAAILYTSVSGQRRLRILNMAYNCCSQMADLFRNCELDILINYMAKIAIRDSLNSNPKAVRETVMNRCAQILACYRKNCASPSSAGQLILPECMKLLPLYSNCIVKSQALQGSEVTTDDRSYLIHCVNGMSVPSSQVFFYPRLLPLHELDPDDEDPDLPTAVRCSYERLKDNGIYLIENGLTMLMWIGLNVPTDWVFGLFGVQSAAQIDIDQTRLQDLDTPRSRQVRTIVQKIRRERFRHLKLVIVRQRDKLEPVFQQHLVEDRSTGGSASYVDFLCHIHKEIRSLLS